MPPIATSLRMSLAVVLLFAQLTGTLVFQRQLDLLPPEHPREAAPAKVDAEQAIRISQVYGGGNVSGAPYPYDFIELFNRSDVTVSLHGWSVQYSLATAQPGTSWSVKTLGEAQIAPYSYLLVGLAQGEGSTSIMPDVTGTINLDAYNGKAAVVNGISSIKAITDPAVVDALGYGTANAWEGSTAAPKLAVTKSAMRKGGGCIDTDQNAADFDALDVAPRNSQSPANICDIAAPSIDSTTPAPNATGVTHEANLAVTFSEPVTLDTNWFSVACDLSGTRDAGTATVTGGPQTFTIDPDEDFLASDTCHLTIHALAVHDSDTIDPPDTLAADYVIDFQTAPPLAAELSSFTARPAGERVELIWETVSEQDVAGFDLYRSNSSSGPWERANASLIPASAPGAGGGASYRYNEPTCSAGTWWYRLDAVDLAGNSQALTLAQVDILAPTSVGLTRLRADTSHLPVALAMLVAGAWTAARIIRVAQRAQR